MTTRERWLRRLTVPLGLLLLAGTAALGVRQLDPPAADTPGTDGVSVQRALTHVEQLGAAPRLVGSRASVAARDYIRRALAEAGLETTEQEAPLLRRSGSGQFVFIPVRNVLARLRGETSTRALLLMAHYDTIHSSPGAADDASGVAALIEAARVLRGGPLPRNDVIFLFTDAEEFGLAGADAFVTQHPWAADVAVVLNFEARGSSGPSLMFEAPGGNGWLVRLLATGTAYPRASSLYQDIYRLMPNGTDMDVFQGRHVAGMNFAFVDRPGTYHTSGDAVAVLDRASLRHQVSNAVSIGQLLAHADLTAPRAQDVVYFTLGNTLLVYSRAWQSLIALVAAIALILTIGYAIRHRIVSARPLAIAIVACLAALLLACALMWGLRAGLSMAAPGLNAPGLALYINTGYALGIVFVCAALLLAAFDLTARRASRAARLLASATVGLAAACALAILLPDAAYLLQWPSLASVIGAGLLMRFGEPAFWERSGQGGYRLPDVLLALGCALPVVLLIAPAVSVLFSAFGLDGAPYAAFALVLAFALIAPALFVLTDVRRWRATLTVLAAAIAALVAGVLQTRIDAVWPRSTSIFYARSLDEPRAVWATRERSVDPWTTQFLGTAPSRGLPLPCLAGSLANGSFFRPTPIVPVRETGVQATQRTEADGSATIELRISAGDGASLAIRDAAPSKTGGLLLAQVGATPMEAAYQKEPFSVLFARAEAGEELSIRFRAASPAPRRLVLIDAIDGLPARSDVTPRPAWMVRGTGGSRMFNETSVTCRTVSVDVAPAAAVPAAASLKPASASVPAATGPRAAAGGRARTDARIGNDTSAGSRAGTRGAAAGRPGASTGPARPHQP